MIRFVSQWLENFAGNGENHGSIIFSNKFFFRVVKSHDYMIIG